MELLENAIERDKDCVANKDRVLRNNFAEKVRDSDIRRILKKKIHDDQKCTFRDVRAESYLWMEDEVDTQSRPASNEVEAYEADSYQVEELREENWELKSQMRNMQKNINTLQQQQQQQATILEQQLTMLEKQQQLLSEQQQQISQLQVRHKNIDQRDRCQAMFSPLWENGDFAQF